MDTEKINSYSFRTPEHRWWTKETVAVVTGANKGIGFSLVRQLSELGLTVILTARDEVKGLRAMNILNQDYGFSSLRFHSLDVSDPTSIEAFASWLVREFGFLDILVNNAAVSFNDIHENSVDHAEIVINTNYLGAKRLTEALLPAFRRESSMSRILNLSSRLGSLNKMRNSNWKRMLESENLTEQQIEEMTRRFVEQVKDGRWEGGGWPKVWTAYAVSKMALNSYSGVLANRFRGIGLSVNCYCPGFTRTSMTRERGGHSPDKAAEIAAMLVLQPPQTLPTGKFFLGPSSIDSISKL